MRLAALLPIALTLLCANSLPGALTQWAFDTITFPDGGTVSGSFIHDSTPSSAAGLYIGIDIVTTPGMFGAPGTVYGDYVGLQYPPLSSGFPDTFFRIVPDATASDLDGVRMLTLSFDQSIVFSGATQVGVTVTESTCVGAQCSSITAFRGGVGSARIVPEPSSAWLLLGGLALAGIGRRLILGRRLP